MIINKTLIALSMQLALQATCKHAFGETDSAGKQTCQLCFKRVDAPIQYPTSTTNPKDSP